MIFPWGSTRVHTCVCVSHTCGVHHIHVCVHHIHVCVHHIHVCVHHIHVCVRHIHVCVHHIHVCVYHIHVCVHHIHVCVHHIHVCVHHIHVCVYHVGMDQVGIVMPSYSLSFITWYAYICVYMYWFIHGVACVYILVCVYRIHVCVYHVCMYHSWDWTWCRTLCPASPGMYKCVCIFIDLSMGNMRVHTYACTYICVWITWACIKFGIVMPSYSLSFITWYACICVYM